MGLATKIKFSCQDPKTMKSCMWTTAQIWPSPCVACPLTLIHLHFQSPRLCCWTRRAGIPCPRLNRPRPPPPPHRIASVVKWFQPVPPAQRHVAPTAHRRRFHRRSDSEWQTVRRLDRLDFWRIASGLRYCWAKRRKIRREAFWWLITVVERERTSGGSHRLLPLLQAHRALLELPHHQWTLCRCSASSRRFRYKSLLARIGSPIRELALVL